MLPSEPSVSLAQRAGSMTSMDDDGAMGVDDHRASNNSKAHNPFKMPSDEEIFSLRDDERARKEEDRRHFLSLPVRIPWKI